MANFTVPQCSAEARFSSHLSQRSQKNLLRKNHKIDTLRSDIYVQIYRWVIMINNKERADYCTTSCPRIIQVRARCAHNTQLGPTLCALCCVVPLQCQIACHTHGNFNEKYYVARAITHINALAGKTVTDL